MDSMIGQKSGTVVPSFTSSLLEELSRSGNVSPEKENIIRDTGTVVYAGGADTVCFTAILFCDGPPCS
jgi:hypothetical protein